MTPKKEYCYKYPRPAYTADCIIFTVNNKKMEILLIKRKFEPFKDYWALPGGFVNSDETGFNAAKRELYEETGIRLNDLTQFGVFDTPGRDPRGRTVSVVYYTFSEDVGNKIIAGDDACEVRLFSITELPKLAFDHKVIIEKAIEKLL